jgi:hypothetical protein
VRRGGLFGRRRASQFCANGLDRKRKPNVAWHMDIDDSCSYHGVMEEEWTSEELRFREESRQKARAAAAIATYLIALQLHFEESSQTSFFAHDSDAIDRRQP